MGVYFKHLLSTLLSAFRKRYGCHPVLTKSMENSKRTLDEGKNVGLILLDLSKAFDCLPRRLLTGKLNACGISFEACYLIKSYLCQRWCYKGLKLHQQEANGKSCRKEYHKDWYWVLFYLIYLLVILFGPVSIVLQLSLRLILNRPNISLISQHSNIH